MAKAVIFSAISSTCGNTWSSSGALNGVSFKPDPVFNVLIPDSCPGVPKEVLIPKNTWRDKAAYDRKASELATRFPSNFAPYAEYAGPEVRAAGPRVT